MSWLFGMGKGQNIPDVPPSLPLPPPASGGDGGGNNQGGGGGSGSGQGQKTAMDAYRFDSAALERAAKAAKDLEQSSKH